MRTDNPVLESSGNDGDAIAWTFFGVGFVAGFCCLIIAALGAIELTKQRHGR